MGGVCSGGTGVGKRNLENRAKTSGFSGKLKSIKSFGKQKDDSYSDANANANYDSGDLKISFSSELKQSMPSRTVATKGTQKSSFLGKAGFVGFERAVEVIDTLGSSMSNLNSNSGFISGVAFRGNRIAILAFEVANTIVKGGNLLLSVSEENIQFIKKDVLHSEGVQKLVSTDMKELLSIAATDKREELNVFSREVIRFGDLCKDPQWHNLDRFFSVLDSDDSNHKQLKSEVEKTMDELTSLAQHTSELYHELNALDRFEQDYRRKLEEVEALHLPRKGESLTILQSELRQQRKLVRSLKKKSLWFRNLEEIVEKLVDVVTYIHQAILEAFGNDGVATMAGTRMVSTEQKKNTQRLGVAGLALHYANVINQIDNIASRPTSLPPNTRDTLYQGLPNSVKTALRSRLQALDAKEELSVSQVKAEMEKTLQWLVPIATNTNKAHQGFGWVGEWANSGPEFGKNTHAQCNLIRLQTLYHADKQKTDVYILELVTWLNQLISLVRQRDHGLKPPPVRSPMHKGLEIHSKMQRFLSMNNSTSCKRTTQLSQEDIILLEEVIGRGRRAPGISKSQELTVPKNRGIRVWTLSRSTGSSPGTTNATARSNSNTNVLDIMDGLDVIF